jgi:hypothetical protein
MNITIQYFLTLFPEFTKVPAAKINAFITVASNRVPSGVWGSVAGYATALLTAHMLSTSGPQGGGSAGGAVTAEQVGELSRSYQFIGEIGSGDAPLMTTRYGVDFVALRKENIIGATTVAMPVSVPPVC